MNETIQTRMREFTQTLLERRGGLVDWPETSEDGTALLPSELARTLNEFEILPLTMQPRPQGLSINLATDFLDRIAPLLEPEPRVGLFQIPEIYLKKSSLEEPIAKAFTWQNVRVKVRAAKPVRVEYNTWFFLAALDSEDRWEELIRLTVNSCSGAQVPMPDPMTLDNLSPLEISSPVPATFDQAARRTEEEVRRRAAAFIARLEGRLERDRKRLRDYYQALLRELKSARTRVPEDPEKMKAKKTAVELEHRRKLAELEDRYRLKLNLTPVVLIRLELPVLAVTCEVFRKQAVKAHTIFWNPVTKDLEPIPRAVCGTSIFSIFFTDNDVKPLCSACWK